MSRIFILKIYLINHSNLIKSEIKNPTQYSFLLQTCLSFALAWSATDLIEMWYAHINHILIFLFSESDVIVTLTCSYISSTTMRWKEVQVFSSHAFTNQFSFYIKQHTQYVFILLPQVMQHKLYYTKEQLKTISFWSILFNYVTLY